MCWFFTGYWGNRSVPVCGRAVVHTNQTRVVLWGHHRAHRGQRTGPQYGLQRSENNSPGFVMKQLFLRKLTTDACSESSCTLMCDALLPNNNKLLLFFTSLLCWDFNDLLLSQIQTILKYENPHTIITFVKLWSKQILQEI